MNQWTWMRKCSLDGKDDQHRKETSRWNLNKRERHQWYKIPSWRKGIQTGRKYEDSGRRN